MTIIIHSLLAIVCYVLPYAMLIQVLLSALTGAYFIFMLFVSHLIVL